MDLQKDEHVSSDLSPQLISIMTTEHYNLQTGRAMTISDVNGRASLFLGTVSSNLIALAFVGQISRLGVAFFVFSFVLLPSLFFLGLVTFERVLQSSIEDTIYARGINRIRHLYLEYAPHMQPYFVLSTHDDTVGIMGNMGVRAMRWQLFLTTGGMIGVINSIIIGAFMGLLLSALFAFTLLLCAGAGVVVFLASVGMHQRYQWKHWRRVEQHFTVLFPSTTGQ